MKRKLAAGFAGVALCAALALRAEEFSLAPAVYRSHSHNDYAQARPLTEALAHHMGGVEADVYFVDGELLVAHDRAQVSPERTLRRLYLEPLRARCAASDGRVYAGGPPLMLLVDIKAEPARVLPELVRELAACENLLTRWRDGQTIPGAIMVVLSGDRPRAEVAAMPDRCVALDGRLEDLDADPPAALVPLVSANWPTVFKWKGTDPMPDPEREKLRALASRAHAQGRRLRFWGAPDAAASWREQFAAGVDFINTDHPAALEEFLRAQAAR